MDKVEKTLKKLNRTDRDRVLETFKRLRAGDLNNLDVKQLKGHLGLYRARKGELRVIFRKTGNTVEIVDVTYRSEKTYRDL